MTDHFILFLTVIFFVNEPKNLAYQPDDKCKDTDIDQNMRNNMTKIVRVLIGGWDLIPFTWRSIRNHLRGIQQVLRSGENPLHQRMTSCRWLLRVTWTFAFCLHTPHSWLSQTNVVFTCNQIKILQFKTARKNLMRTSFLRFF